MAVTAIKIGDVRLKFMTLPTENVKHTDETLSKPFLIIDLYQCDQDFMPTGSASRSLHESGEKEYHVKLRQESIERQHFVQAESTDPEWTPGYISATDAEVLGENGN